MTLSTKDNRKLLQQLKSGFKRTINWNKYQSKVKTQALNPYLDYLVDRSIHGENRLLALSFENITHRTVHIRYYLPKVEIKDYNVMIDGQNFFDQPVKNNLRTYESTRKIASDQGHDYTTGCLLDYNYFNEYYKMTAINLMKQQGHDADPNAIQQINFAGNLNRKNNKSQDINDNTAIFFIIEEARKTILDFSQGAVNLI